MLKLGQDVIIYETPAYGDEYFDEDYIYERATICGITTINDELAYQLEGYDEDSWWVEDELDDEYEYDQDLKPQHMIWETKLSIRTSLTNQNASQVFFL